jgi:hypothetical protein
MTLFPTLAIWDCSLIIQWTWFPPLCGGTNKVCKKPQADMAQKLNPVIKSITTGKTIEFIILAMAMRRRRGLFQRDKRFT